MKHRRLIASILMLAMLILCAAIISVMWVSVSQAQAGSFRWNIFPGSGIAAEADEEKRLAVNGPATLVVKNPMGDITITKGTGSEIQIAAHKTAWGANQAEASRSLDLLQVDISQQKNIITVQVAPEGIRLFDGGENDSVEFTITVPAETAVTAQTGFGNVMLSGVTGPADLHSDYGQIIAIDIKGGLVAYTGSGSIRAQNIQGDEMALDLQSDYGDISLERATAGQLKAYTGSGLIRLAEVKAEDVDLNSDYGQIEFEAGWMARLGIEAGSGQVSLTQLIVNRGLTVNNDYGPILLSQVTAPAYDLNTSSGEINVDEAAGSIKAHSDYGDISVTKAQNATLDLSTSSGTIQFAGSLADNPHQLRTDYGDVRLALPENTGLTLDLKTDYGQINANLPLTVSGSLEETHWQGSVNGGGANLTAYTDSGNISIEILKP